MPPFEPLPRECQFCGKTFIPLEDDEYTCEECCAKFNKKFSKKDFVTTDWEDKKMKKIWDKRYNKMAKNLLSKCDGVNYGKKK